MPNTRDIRRRIKSVKNTAQITKAMQMVAASKMRKAQQLALNGRPYGDLLRKMTLAVRGLTEGETHPLLEERPIKKEIVILISTDKGLCGALNTNLTRLAASYYPATTSFITLGRKGAQWVTRSKRHLLADFQLPDSPSFLESKAISKFVIERFLTKEVDRVTVLSTKFVNTLSQTPIALVALPVQPLPDEEVQEESPNADVSAKNITFEPDPYSFLDSLVPYSVHMAVYGAVLEARASEHSARMVAMKNATDNAKDLIKDLTLEYNKIRQASITTEINEIATAQLALG
ncbi:MAG TPA: ATP synthase F1 subunit gamma [Chthoniobacterales bacterium]